MRSHSQDKSTSYDANKKRVHTGTLTTAAGSSPPSYATPPRSPSRWSAAPMTTC